MITLQDKLARALRAFRDAKAWLASDSYDGVDRNGVLALGIADELAKEALAELDAAQATPSVGIELERWRDIGRKLVVCNDEGDEDELTYQRLDEIDTAVRALLDQPPAPSTGEREGGARTAGGVGTGTVALNVKHPLCHEAADAFWRYWKENGETHKHGYYESTWGAINRAIRMVGVVPHDYGLSTPPTQPESCALPSQAVVESGADAKDAMREFVEVLLIDLSEGGSVNFRGNTEAAAQLKTLCEQWQSLLAEKAHNVKDAEPWNGHRFKQITHAEWKCDCGLVIHGHAAIDAAMSTDHKG